MHSRWVASKPEAMALRKRGFSLRAIEKRLSIPRSTLSGWCKDIKLSPHQLLKLSKDYATALEKARVKASAWHKSQKANRIIEAENQALESLRCLDFDNHSTTELALAVLYWGEGSKRQKGLNLGNSNPDLLVFFISALKFLYQVEIQKIHCELHLRADQTPTKEVAYWAKTLRLPKTNFKRVYLDKRTYGTKTFPDYHGVCLVSYNNVALQRKLMYLYSLYARKVIQKCTLSSVG